MRSSVKNSVSLASRIVAAGAGVMAGLFVVAAGAAEPCGLCDSEIVTNSALAECFLGEYQQLADKANGAVVVDLSHCEASRGVVEALPVPGTVVEEPDVKFMLTRAQLDCLKKKLEQPDLVLDPSVKIDLGSCA